VCVCVCVYVGVWVGGGVCEVDMYFNGLRSLCSV
jgi:hypothetical protein